MQWISNFQLFLLDFDGLLVNTEEIHYRAYQQMCLNYGVTLPWDFPRYCQAAHYHADALRIEMLVACPELKKKQPDWQVLHKEKQQEMQKLLKSDAVQLMPGVAPFLKELEAKNIPRVVVTHSPDELVNILRERHPILNTIPHWLTRNHYTHPKPDPECYLKAIELLGKPGDKIIGFEDTPRGMWALMGTSAKPVIVCQVEYPEIAGFIEKGALHFKSFEDLLNVNTLS
jgi:beta-phosphoglucomutase